MRNNRGPITSTRPNSQVPLGRGVGMGWGGQEELEGMIAIFHKLCIPNSICVKAFFIPPALDIVVKNLGS